MMLHLSGLNLICHFFSHFSRIRKSCWSATQSSYLGLDGTVLGPVDYTIVSKEADLGWDVISGRLLIYVRNSNGPRTVPFFSCDMCDIEIWIQFQAYTIWIWFWYRSNNIQLVCIGSKSTEKEKFWSKSDMSTVSFSLLHEIHIGVGVVL